MFWMFAPDAFVAARKIPSYAYLDIYGMPGSSKIIYLICSTFTCGPTDIFIEFCKVR